MHPHRLPTYHYKDTLTCTHMHSVSLSQTHFMHFFFFSFFFKACNILWYYLFFLLCTKITTRLNGTKWKPDRCPYHIWSIATCCVLKNERLYLKHERQVCFPPLFILVDFPWGIVMPVSVDTLIEMCEVKTIVYINARDLCSTIIGLSPSPRDYTGFKWKNGFLQYNTEGF